MRHYTFIRQPFRKLKVEIQCSKKRTAVSSNKSNTILSLAVERKPVIELPLLFKRKSIQKTFQIRKSKKNKFAYINDNKLMIFTRKQ